MAKVSWSKKIGRGLAHVQAFADDLVEWGFEKMAKSGKKKPESKLGKIAQFLGETGQSFYQKYEQIKSEKRKKQGK